MAPGFRQRRRRPRVDRRGAHHARGGHRPRHPRDVPLPAELAQHAHSSGDDSRVAHRHVCVHQAARLLDQYADALRHRARDRYRRGRCDCRDREHRTAHPRVRQDGAPGGDRRHAGSVLRGRRHRYRSGGGLRAGGLFPRHDGPDVSAVLDDDCHCRRPVGVQCRHIHACAGGAAPGERKPGARPVFLGREPCHRRRDERVRSSWYAGRSGGSGRCWSCSPSGWPAPG